MKVRGSCASVTTVRATETSLFGLPKRVKRAILPAATGDLHHIGCASALCELACKDGDSVPGIRQIMVEESVLRDML